MSPGTPRGDAAGTAGAAAQALLALARARFDRFRDAVGDPAMPAWADLSDGARVGWSTGLEHFVPVVLAAGAERRQRARFMVGAPDVTDGRGEDCCLSACGPWECTRKPHGGDVHAAGAGGVIVAAWECS